MKQRVIWVDYAKAIGIILVVYGHVARGINTAGLPIDKELFNMVDKVIYSFHMPLFFFLSALFYYDSLQKYGRRLLVINRLKTILYPYFVWASIQVSIEVFLSKYTREPKSFNDLLAIIWSPPDQFWFLYTLFFITLFLSFIYYKLNPKYFLWLTVFLSILKVSGVLKEFPIPVLTFLSNLIFFTLGIWFNQYKDRLQTVSLKLVLLFVILFAGAQTLILSVDITNYTVLRLCRLILTDTSIFFVVFFCIWLSRYQIKWLWYLGSSSMSI